MKQKVTLIGLGKMGITLANLLIKQNYSVTVWNRTESKAESLISKGAKLAGSIIEAIQSSETIIICVFDYNAVNEILNQENILKILNGKTIVNLTTGNPSEAKHLNQVLEQSGARYLDGAILAGPEQMGQDDTTIYISGSETGYEGIQEILKKFGGNIKFLGTSASAAAAFDEATLYYMYGSLIGLFQGALIAQKENIDISYLGKTISEIAPGYAQFIKFQADKIQAENFKEEQSSIAINVNAINRMYETAKSYQVALRFPELLRHYFSAAEKQNLNNEELASLIKIFRSEK